MSWERRPKTPQVERLVDLYRIMKGPVATTLDNRREPFLPVAPERPGKNVYPLDVTAEELENYLDANPESRADLLAERTVVRRATSENLSRDLASLEEHPALRTLHPGLDRHLRTLARTPSREAFYAVPYAVAWADDLLHVYSLLREAADLVESDDAELARYLRNRARDLLANDYESGDASWITGRFERLNVQIGAYETYDDSLFGVKAFHSLSLLATDEAATAELRRALGDLQAVEDALPYEARKRVRTDIPVGVYDVVADFGQARGTNTATILPNDALFSRRYGRTILMRRNIIENPDLVEIGRRAYAAAVGVDEAAHYTARGGLTRTLWHEIGHYLGVDQTADGRSLDVALGGSADALEEMKADLVSLFANERRYAAGEVEAAIWRGVRASGVRRTLQNNRPRRDQPYQTMQLVQFNVFREQGLLELAADGTLTVDHERYPQAVEHLLRQVLELQRAGDAEAASAFLDRWTEWTEAHDALAVRIRDAQGPRFRLVRYAALGE